MGVLVWLMLVVKALAAAPMGMTEVRHPHSMHAMVAAASEYGHHDVAAEASRSCCDDQVGCGGGMTGYTCHCAARCSTTLPPAAVVVLTSVAITASYSTPLPSDAPSLNSAPVAAAGGLTLPRFR